MRSNAPCPGGTTLPGGQCPFPLAKLAAVPFVPNAWPGPAEAKTFASVLAGVLRPAICSAGTKSKFALCIACGHDGEADISTSKD